MDSEDKESNINTNNKEESSNHPKPKYMPKRLHRQNKNDKEEKNVTRYININKQLENGFLLNAQGVIESGIFEEGEAIYCKYNITYGQDWSPIKDRPEEGLSQHACKGEGSDNKFIWNLPFEIGLKSNNPSGWPQLVVSCYCPDFFGREILKAYGVCYFPTTPGMHERTLYTFSPVCSSGLIEAVGIFLGLKAEINKPAHVLSTGEGRENIRAQPEGTIHVKFNIHLTNMECFGYNK